MRRIAILGLVYLFCASFSVLAGSPSQQEITDAENFNQALAEFAGSGCPHLATGRELSGGADNSGKSPWLSAGMDWVLPGSGRMYNGSYFAGTFLMVTGAALFTYTQFKVKPDEPNLYPIMLGAILTVNTGIALDTFWWTKKRNKAARQ